MSSSIAVPRVRLGSSTLEVTRICLGSMTWGQQNTVDEGVQQLNYAFGSGAVNFIDTAEMYPVPSRPETQGDTDRVIATWLRSRHTPRNQIVLASKVCGYSERLNWMPGRGGRLTRVTPEQIKVSVQESLSRLGTDYLDLLQIHWPDRYVPLFGGGSYNASLEREDTVSFEAQLLALHDLVRDGLVRYVGLSNETPYGVMKFSAASAQLGLSTRMVSIQNSYSLLVRSDFENGLAEVCSPRHENVGLLAYSPLAGGVLTGKYARSDCPSTARLNLFPGYMARYRQSMAQTAVAEYTALAQEIGMTPTQLALAWCYSRPHVTSTIIGATSLDQLKENVDAFALTHLIDEDVLQRINSIYRRFRDPSNQS